MALYDAGTVGGMFGSLGVGEGKELTTFLLPAVLRVEKPLLLLPGGLIENAQRERLRLSYHWRIPTSLRIFSYDMLGRVNAAEELENYRPGALIGNEAHKLKNKHAAVTRRVARYMHDYPLTKCCMLSGSFMDKSLKDFAHILLWCLKLGAPLPTSTEEIEEWAEALDVGVDPLARRRPGALLEFASPQDTAEPEVAARRGFQRRLTETPGVVATVGEGTDVGASIYVRAIRYDVAPVTEQNFELVRRFELPAGQITAEGDEQLMTAVDVWRHAQSLALGLHYAWDPPAPAEWRAARKAWHSFVRETISRSRTFDSELHVANACDAGRLDGAALARWRAVRDSFKPNVVPIWHDDSALKVCAAWMKKPGLVWTEHGFFAERLSKLTGAPYFGAAGYDATGRYIEDATPGTSGIASVDANREGKNLQALWSRSLMVCPPSSATWWEQTIARVHRPGQKADEVIVDVLIGCRENYDACLKAIEAARAVQDVTGKKQKLLLADVTLPGEDELGDTPRWVR